LGLKLGFWGLAGRAGALAPSKPDAGGQGKDGVASLCGARVATSVQHGCKLGRVWTPWIKDVARIRVRRATARRANGGDARLGLGSSPAEALCFGVAKAEERGRRRGRQVFILKRSNSSIHIKS